MFWLVNRMCWCWDGSDDGEILIVGEFVNLMGFFKILFVL